MTATEQAEPRYWESLGIEAATLPEAMRALAVRLMPSPATAALSQGATEIETLRNALAGVARPEAISALLAAIEDRVYCAHCDGEPGDDACSNCHGWGHDGSDLAIALEEVRGERALAAIGALPAEDGR